MEKDIPRLKLKRVDGELIQFSDIRNADQPRIEDLVQRQLYFLKHLAFDGLIDNVIEFEPKHLNSVNNDRDHRLFLDSLLPHLSFLRTSNPSAQYPDQSYHFIHLTFQEYFAARYFVRQWSRDSHLKRLMSSYRKDSERVDSKPAEFLAKYKYDQRLNVMWRFAAGLLDAIDNKGGHHATCFLKVIEQEPRDLLGPAHQRLVMHCLSEVVSSGGSDFSTYKEHLEDILAQWLCIESEVGRESFLAAEPEFPEKALEKVLKQGSEKTRKAIVEALVRRRAPHAALNAVLLCLDDGKSSDRMREDILCLTGNINTPLAENQTRSVVAYLGSTSHDLRRWAWSILLSQPTLSRDIVKLIGEKTEKDFENKSMGSRPRILELMAKNSALAKEAIQLAAAQLEDSALPPHIRQLAAAQRQDQHSDLIEGISLEMERFITSHEYVYSNETESKVSVIRQIPHLRQTALRVLREHSAFPIHKFSWLEEQLRACGRIDQALRKNRYLSNRGFTKSTLRSNDRLADEILQILQLSQKFDLSKEALLSVAKQFKADGAVDRRLMATFRTLQFLGNRSDLSKEVLLLVVEQLKVYTAARRSLQVLRCQSNLSKEILHEVAEIFTSQLLPDTIQDDAAEFLTSQPALPEEILCSVKAWQEDRHPSRHIETILRSKGRSSLSEDTLLSVASKLKSNEAQTREAAVKCLSAQLALSEDVLRLIAELLKDTVYEINQAAARVLMVHIALPDAILQSVAEQLEHADYNIKQAAGEILNNQTVLPDKIFQLAVKQLEKKSKSARVAALRALNNQSNLSTRLLRLVEEQLKDKDSAISSRAVQVLKRQTALPDEILQLIVKRLENEIFCIMLGKVIVFKNRGDLSQDLFDLIASQPVYQTSVTQGSVYKIPPDRKRSVLSKKIIDLVETVLKNGPMHRLRSLLGVLASQPALPERTLQLVAQQLRESDEWDRKAIAEFLKHQPVLPVAVLELLGELITNDVFEEKGQKEAADILKGQSSLPGTVLRLVEKPLRSKSISSSTWTTALEILRAQSALPEESLEAIVTSFDERSGYYQDQLVETLFSQPALYTGVLSTHLDLFFIQES
jgi:NTP pyrophosphatase (non-canonical NTP hydrolase)